MAAAGEWAAVEEAAAPAPEEAEGGDNLQAAERRRRLRAAGGSRTHRRHLQDVVGFLREEAGWLGEHLAWEVRAEGREQAARVRLGPEQAEGRGKTAKLAREAAAKALLQRVGPWLEEAVWESHTASLAAALPPEHAAWLPPVWDARHLSLPAEPAAVLLYEVEVQLGPLSCLLAGPTLGETAAGLARHLARLLRTRDLTKLAALPTDESIGEMSVAGQPYAQGREVLTVQLEGAYCLPPLDLALLQQRLGGARLPAAYTAKDEWACSRSFTCRPCSLAIDSVEDLDRHVVRRTDTPWHSFPGQQGALAPAGEAVRVGPAAGDLPRRGRGRGGRVPRLPGGAQAGGGGGALRRVPGVAVQVQQVWCSVSAAGTRACCEAHGRTRLTKGHEVTRLAVMAGPRHPREDEEAGVAVPRDSLAYLLAVYASLPPPEAGPGAVPFAPPPAPEADYESLYSGGGSTVRMGWGAGGTQPGPPMPPFPGMGGEFAGNPLGHPFAPMGGPPFGPMGGPPFPPGFGYGYPGPGPGGFHRGRGFPGRGRGGRRPPGPRAHHDVGELLIPEDGEVGNTAYTGKRGLRGTVNKGAKCISCYLPPGRR
jgi:hypothetical protein